MTVSTAFCSAPSFTARHCSLVDMYGGKADMSTARFYATVLEYSPSFGQVLHDLSNATMTLSGGTYSYWDGKALQTVRGTANTFRLIYDYDYDVPAYFPAVSDDAIFFLNEADGGLNGVNVSCNFPDNPSINVSGTVPDFRTTQEQLASFAPYIEYVYSADEFAGIRVRLVNSSNVSVPVPQNRSIDIHVGFNFAKKEGHDGVTGTNFDVQNLTFAAGEIPEGTLMFPDYTKDIFDDFTASDLLYVNLDMTVRSPESGNPDEVYTWYYSNANARTRNHLTLWTNQTSNAGLVNGKSDYSSTKFGNLYIDLFNDLAFPEAKHFTSEGSITIPGGGYTVRNLGTVPEGQDTTYRLAVRYSVNLVWRWYRHNLAYEIVDSEGRLANGRQTFFVETEKALNGRTLTWTFPDELDLNGRAVIPEFKTTAEQVAEGVPYIELLTSGDRVSGVRYRIVTADDTNTAITPKYRTDWGINVYTKDGYEDAGHAKNSSSGEITFDRYSDYDSPSYTVDDVEQVRARLITYENPDNPCVYQWYFRPSFGTGLPEGTIQPTQQLTPDVLENIVQAVDGINSADEISYITSVNIGGVSDPTDEMTQTVQEDSREIIGAMNTLSVDKSGWYVMKLTLSDELFELVRGMKPEDLKVYSLADSDSQPNAALINGILNTFELLSITGEKIDTIGARELLMVGLLEAGESFSMFLAKLIIAMLADGCTTGFTFTALLTITALFIMKHH